MSAFASTWTARIGLSWLLASGLTACSDDAVPPADLGPDAAVDVAGDDGPDGGGIDGSVTYTEERAPCDDRDPLRNVYWGDTHIHTRNSFDAWVFDVRTTPEQAYDFARGEPVALPPLDEHGQGTVVVRLDRPLDFAAVTDHSEYLAEVESCLTPESQAYDLPICVRYREGGRNAIIEFGLGLSSRDPERSDICDPGRVDCPAVASDVWDRIQGAAEAFYDRSSACQFSTFVAYEYSANPGVSNLHRNILFRNEVVPDVPVSTFEEPSPNGLWQRLTELCLDAETGCDVLAIPHNSNWSNGRLFQVEYPGAETLDDERAQAARRAALEPLVEIYQHKGDSECRNGFAQILGAPDELCDFEKLRREATDDCLDGVGEGAMAGLGCVSRLDFVRNVLIEGLIEDERLGVNPYALGIIAGTDTHNGIAGDVDEETYVGHWGNNEESVALRLGRGALNPGGVIFSPGGIAGVWAVENSRDALFEAMRRREVFGTSGPRIVVRLFGGWSYPETLCDQADLVEIGYRRGVPMGGVLPERSPGDPAPTLVVSAFRDPGTEVRSGTPLQRIQIVKGWIAGGQRHVEVFDVAGDADDGATVDLDTCEPEGEGFDTLCAVWSDPAFDPDQHAYYYSRVLENPTCRWSTRQCNQLPEDRRPESCTADDIPQTIQERAWTSPIWYRP